MRLREWDCGRYDAQSEFGRITVRERADGLYDLIHVRYERTARKERRPTLEGGTHLLPHVYTRTVYALGGLNLANEREGSSVDPVGYRG
jgi:hypothetical protein